MDKKLYKSNSIIKSVDEKNKQVTAYVSPAVIDRVGDLIPPEEWNLTNYKNHPVLLSQHDWYGSIKSQIGEVIDIGIDDKGLYATMEYYVGKGNEEADWAWFLASKNRSAYSVGFYNKGGEETMSDNDNKSYNILKNCELLEISQVMIPANQDAVSGNKSLVKTMKEFLDTRETKQDEGVDEDNITKLFDELRKEIDEIKQILLKAHKDLDKTAIADEVEDVEYDNEDAVVKMWKSLHKKENENE